MDTESVRLFVLAAEKLNISAAGRELGVAPAVAGAKLAKLEKALGTGLLRRSTRKVALSLEGQSFCLMRGKASPKRTRPTPRWDAVIFRLLVSLQFENALG